MHKFLAAPLGATIAAILVACSGSADAEPPMELSAGGGDAMASCLAFDPAILAEFPVAFEGTVTEVEGDRVTLDVDHWYAGGESEQVALVAPQGLEALIDGIAFEDGKQYLVSATDGQVNYCGFSGESTPELRAGYEAAFGS